MNALLIMNPRARSGRGRKLWNGWARGLEEARFSFDRIETHGPGHACDAAREARDRRLVVAVGGDGTINEVLDGVMQSGRTDLAMGVLYAGTSPDFCRFHGIPVDPSRALAALVNGEVRRVDVARIRYAGPDGQKLRSHFGCSCNIGLGAAVARYSNRIRRIAGDRLGTFMAVLLAVARIAPSDLEVRVDGRNTSLPRTNNLSVLKNPHIASGLKLNIELRPDDGTLYALGLSGRSRFGVIRALPGFYSGRAARGPGHFQTPLSSIAVSSGKKQEIEFDGDPRGFLPAEIEILPRVLCLKGGAP